MERIEGSLVTRRMAGLVPGLAPFAAILLAPAMVSVPGTALFPF